jgi:hypothetical protein
MPVNARNIFLGGLIAFFALACALLTTAPKASADKSDCPSAKICLWDGPTFGGQQSFWNGYETGCHALENIDPSSVYNNTNGHWAHFYTGPFGEIDIAVGPGKTYQFGGDWTKGFCIT